MTPRGGREIHERTVKPATTPQDRARLRAALLAWYDSAGRSLPWRTRGGRPDPYRVWLSEIMLQQTTAAAVGPYFTKFLGLFPTLEALAAAPREAVLEAWAGLGYYSRARNLHAAAQKIAAGGFPDNEAAWRALPGVGPYTAAALAAIAQDQPANVVDGNVERVMARLFAVETALPGAKPELRRLAGAFVAPERPGDWAQALMDLGATVCMPRSPKCCVCPVNAWCAAFASGAPESYPRKAPKAARPERFGVAFRIVRDGALWLVRRPDKGLLGGMAGLPTTEWRPREWRPNEALAHAPARGPWSPAGRIRHVFTHFALSLDVVEAQASPDGEGWWGSAAELPSVFRKAAQCRAKVRTN
jgi:A/G-specific adenine glycosylase